MNLTQFSIEKNRISLALLVVVVIMGLTLYQTLSRDSMPPYTVRVATVVSQFPGASPERVELLVTDKIEKKAQEIPEVKSITSTSRTGLSVVSVELKFEVSPNDLQAVWDELRRKLEEIDELPDGVDPELNDSDVGVVYGIMVGLLSDGFSYAEMKDYADDIRDSFIKLDDAAKVELGGVQEERVFIEYNNARLAEYGITASQLQSIISSTNIINTGGEINLEHERIIIEPSGNFNDISDLRRTVVPVGNEGQVTYLEDITDVSQSYIYPSKTKVRVNGYQAIALSVSLKEGANIINLGQQVDQLIESWNQELPIGISLTRLASLDAFVQNSIDDFVNNLIQSMVIVLLVMLLFLGFRTGVVVASLIPLVTIMTLLIMGMLGLGLNQVTLAALIMALGMMVDNAIVVSESIMVKMENGIAPKKAAIDSCSELTIPLLISTLTTSAAFLSFFLAESTMGDIVGPIFSVITIALLCSWLLSLTIISLLAYYFIRVNKKSQQQSSKKFNVDRIIEFLKKEYQVILLKVLNRKKVFVGVVVLTFILALFGFNLVPFIFFPDSERNLVTVDINLNLGTRIETSEEIIHSIEQYITDSLLAGENQRGVVDWSSFIGQGPESYDLGYSQDEANSSYAHMLLNTSSGDDNQYVIERLDAFCLAQFPEADIKVRRLGQGGGGTPIEIRISGSDPGTLMQIGDRVKKQLTSVYGTKNVNDNWGPKIKKFLVDIDQTKAQRAGVTNQDIAISLKTVMSGFRTGEFREDDKTIPIEMRGEDSEQQTLASLETLNIYAQNSGVSVPLVQVAQVVPQWQFAKIIRRDLDRTITVESYLKEDGNASVVMSQVQPWLDEESSTWPSGYYYELGGDDENTAENMGSVISYLPLSGFIILMLLIIQFNSTRKTFMVISTIPLGVIGVVAGLILFRSYFGFFAFLGTISLAGIVINNAIVLIDRIEIEIKENHRSPADAVVEAALQRFRPIILTTFTTSLGLIPLYLGGGIMWEPLALAIMIGLLFATIITLLFIPVLYSLLYRVDFKEYVQGPSTAIIQ